MTSERFTVIRNPRSGFWEVRERVGTRSVLRGRRLSPQGANQAKAELEAQVTARRV